MKRLLNPLFHYRITLSCVFFALLILSCKKDSPVEIADLTFPSDTYYIPVGGEILIRINQGNNKYKLDMANEAIIQSRSYLDHGPADAFIYVSGLKKGSSELTVTDEFSGQTETLIIHVVDPFLVLGIGEAVPGIMVDRRMYVPNDTRDAIRNEAKSYGVFKQNEVLILQNNGEQRFYVFDNPGNLNIENQTLNTSNIKYVGTYEFGVTQDSSPFDEGKLQQLILHPENEEEPINLPVRVYSQNANQILTGFIENTNILLGQPAVEHYGYSYQDFSFHKDLTAHFNTDHPDYLQYVYVSHGVKLWQNFHNYGLKIGDDILK